VLLEVVYLYVVVPLFDPITDAVTVSRWWKKWIWRFENLLISLWEFDLTIQQGLLLTYVGEATNIFDILLPDTGTIFETAIKVWRSIWLHVETKM
jgi:hypothetical protein